MRPPSLACQPPSEVAITGSLAETEINVVTSILAYPDDLRRNLSVQHVVTWRGGGFLGFVVRYVY